MTTFYSPHRRIARMAMAMASVAVLTLALSITTVLAWMPPVRHRCSPPDADHYAWRINLSQEPNYLIQMSWNADFSNKWTVNFGSPGSPDFDTIASGSTLYVRWASDIAKKASAAADGQLCVQPTPSPGPRRPKPDPDAQALDPNPILESEIGGNRTDPKTQLRPPRESELGRAANPNPRLVPGHGAGERVQSTATKRVGLANETANPVDRDRRVRCTADGRSVPRGWGSASRQGGPASPPKS